MCSGSDSCCYPAQAVAALGVLLGAGLIIIVYILSYITIDILARCTASLLWVRSTCAAVPDPFLQT